MTSRSSPRLIRFQQIRALIKAFFGENTKIKLSGKAKSIFVDTNNMTIQSILSGDFIKRRTISDYVDLIEMMKYIVKENEKEVYEDKEIHIMKLIMPYQQLIKYKQQLMGLLTFNSGWLEASSITSRFSIYLTDSISSDLINKYSKLDTALELFLNPTRLTFTEDELMTKYKFPTQNLSETDLDLF